MKCRQYSRSGAEAKPAEERCNRKNGGYNALAFSKDTYDSVVPLSGTQRTTVE